MNDDLTSLLPPEPDAQPNGLGDNIQDKTTPLPDAKPDMESDEEPDARPDPLQGLIDLLDPDAETAALKYIQLQKKLHGYFKTKGDSEPGQAADETIDRVAKKIAGGAVVPAILPFCWGIARLVTLERRRHSIREAKTHHIFAEEFPQNLSAMSEEAYQDMVDCFAALAERKRRLLTKYYQNLPEEAQSRQREKLADEGGMSLAGLRMKVYRLRTILQICLEGRRKK